MPKDKTLSLPLVALREGGRIDRNLCGDVGSEGWHSLSDLTRGG